MSKTGSPAFTRGDAEIYAVQLNESYIGPGPFKAKHSAIECAWYVSKVCEGREVERIYQRVAA